MLLGLLPGVEVVGAARDGEEAVALAAELAPDVVLMDLRMPRCDGVEATRRIREGHPGTEIVVLTTYADDDSLFPALRAGARGYLTKDASGEEIVRALRDVTDGRAGLSPSVQRRLLEQLLERNERPERNERAGWSGRPERAGRPGDIGRPGDVEDEDEDEAGAVAGGRGVEGESRRFGSPWRHRRHRQPLPPRQPRRPVGRRAHGAGDGGARARRGWALQPGDRRAASDLHGHGEDTYQQSLRQDGSA